MLQFQGRNITSEFDLLKVKVQAIDFIKPIKFQNSDLEKLADLTFELAKELIFNQVDAYICLNFYNFNREKGLEMYVYNKNMSLEKAQEALNNSCSLSKKGISLDRKSGFLDKFKLKKEIKSGIEVNIFKLLKL
jgi:HD-GYP domain-containing protein (c-di-GMP phosphodiesterase class II)